MSQEARAAGLGLPCDMCMSANCIAYEWYCFDMDIAAGHVSCSRICISLAQMALQGTWVCALHFSAMLNG